jgi:mono/diheme cytochrome c family protein
MSGKLLAVAVAFFAASGVARADEATLKLTEGPGHDVVAVNCGACHSLDYIMTNAPFLTSKQWEAEVAKMINAYGADIAPPDAKTIVDYLTRHYGGGG